MRDALLLNDHESVIKRFGHNLVPMFDGVRRKVYRDW